MSGRTTVLVGKRRVGVRETQFGGPGLDGISWGSRSHAELLGTPSVCARRSGATQTPKFRAVAQIATSTAAPEEPKGLVEHHARHGRSQDDRDKRRVKLPGKKIDVDIAGVLDRNDDGEDCQQHTHDKARAYASAPKNGRVLATMHLRRSPRVGYAARFGHPDFVADRLTGLVVGHDSTILRRSTEPGPATTPMTLRYARISNRVVADEYDAVSAKVEALYRDPTLPAEAEGPNMRRLREEVHHRLLGNGWCQRPAVLDCHFESICESCTHFATDATFTPVLLRQRDHAAANRQDARAALFDRLLADVERKQ